MRLLLSPTVWVDVFHAKEKAAIEKQIKDLETRSKPKIEALEKEGKMTEAAQEKVQMETKIKELKAEIPKAIFPMKNPAVISMGAAFLIGIFFSLAGREKEAEDKFEEEKLRTYVGIGAE